MSEEDRALKARREEHIKALQEMRKMMFEDENWESMSQGNEMEMANY